jgi:NADP-dependent 3-hydroxy acid dehydrogenase YdfG
MAFIARRKEDSMPHISSGAALVTGASSGIGRATAHALAAAGYPTVATARHPEALADLAAAGCYTLALDVTDEGSMTRAVRAVEDAHGGIAALIASTTLRQISGLCSL